MIQNIGRSCNGNETQKEEAKPAILIFLSETLFAPLTLYQDFIHQKFFAPTQRNKGIPDRTHAYAHVKSC